MSPAKKGVLFILSAPSGAGKTTLCRMLLSRFPDLRYSVSYTTRSPRPGEQNGVDYHFISPEEFEQRRREGKWAEWAEVYGNRYGTSAEWIDRERAAGHDVLLDIDVQGARQIRDRYPESETIFIAPPSKEVLRERLEKRGTDRPEIIERRLKAAAEEMEQSSLYRHIVVNDRLEEAIAELVRIVSSKRCRTHPKTSCSP